MSLKKKLMNGILALLILPGILVVAVEVNITFLKVDVFHITNYSHSINLIFSQFYASYMYE